MIIPLTDPWRNRPSPADHERLLTVAEELIESYLFELSTCRNHAELVLELGDEVSADDVLMIVPSVLGEISLRRSLEAVSAVRQGLARPAVSTIAPIGALGGAPAGAFDGIAA